MGRTTPPCITSEKATNISRQLPEIKPQIISFFSNKNAINSGERVQFTWLTLNASKFVIDVKNQEKNLIIKSKNLDKEEGTFVMLITFGNCVKIQVQLSIYDQKGCNASKYVIINRLPEIISCSTDITNVSTSGIVHFFWETIAANRYEIIWEDAHMRQLGEVLNEQKANGDCYLRCRFREHETEAHICLKIYNQFGNTSKRVKIYRDKVSLTSEVPINHPTWVNIGYIISTIASFLLLLVLRLPNAKDAVGFIIVYVMIWSSTFMLLLTNSHTTTTGIYTGLYFILIFILAINWGGGNIGLCYFFNSLVIAILILHMTTIQKRKKRNDTQFQIYDQYGKIIHE